MTRIEVRIEQREKILSALNNDMQRAAERQEGRKIADLSRAIHSAQAELDKLYEDLEDCTLRLEKEERNL
jgi:hypothetical protein